VNRIFFTLATVSNLGLAWTFWLGWSIDDPHSATVDAQSAVTWHFLTALGAAVVALLVHAIALTYFMGTGRWIEETCDAYSLGPTARQENIRLKYRAVPGMVGCVLLVVATGALGAMSDPAANIQWGPAPKVHLALAIVTLSANVLVSWTEYTAIARNGRIVDEVTAEVRRIRHERGLS
jgi:hypothetical protein